MNNAQPEECSGPVVIGDAVLYLGDCLDVLRTIPDCSVDAVVTDPPAGIGFMGKEWDHHKGGRAQWVAWMTDVAAECLRVLKSGGHALVWALPRTSHWTATALEDAGFEIRDRVAHVFGSGFPKSRNIGNGWGTALKPAMEDWWLCRKPLVGTVAANVQEHGTGALNIDGCRVATDENLNGGAYAKNGSKRTDEWGAHNGFRRDQGLEYKQPPGRWPANLVHDGSDEVVELFPQANSARASGNPNNPKRGKNHVATSYGQGDDTPTHDYRDTGSAARFFYCAKASKADRDEDNKHPTVKPTALMRWLCRLITPPGGVILDPFMGSGSTGKAAMLEDFRFIGIERDPEYMDIAAARIASVQRTQDSEPSKTATPG